MRSGGSIEGVVAVGGGENGENGSIVCFVGKWGTIKPDIGIQSKLASAIVAS